MKLLCPVAKCHEKVSPENYYDHVIEYEEEHKDNPLLAKSHDRFADPYVKSGTLCSLVILEIGVTLTGSLL